MTLECREATLRGIRRTTRRHPTSDSERNCGNHRNSARSLHAPCCIDRAELEALRAQLTGQLITADSAAFDVARKVVYITVDRRPLAIIRAATTADIAAAVRFAGERGLPLAASISAAPRRL